MIEDIEKAIKELSEDLNTTWGGLDVETIEILEKELIEKIKCQIKN